MATMEAGPRLFQIYQAITLAGTKSHILYALWTFFRPPSSGQSLKGRGVIFCSNTYPGLNCAAVSCTECIVGVILSAIVFRQWLRCYHKVTPVIQAYILVFFPDCMTCVLYLARSSYSLKTGKLYTGPGEKQAFLGTAHSWPGGAYQLTYGVTDWAGDIWFCKLSAFITIAGCVALAFGKSCVPFLARTRTARSLTVRIATA